MAIFSETIKLIDEVSPNVKKATSSFDVLTKALAGTQSALVKANALGDTNKIDKLTQQSQKYSQALTQLGPAEGEASAGAGELFAELSAATGGLIDVAAAALAVVAGFGALVIAGAAFAISANEAKQKAITLFDALGEGKTTGAETVAMLDKLGDSIGQTRAQLEPLAKGFLTMGITGTDQLRSLTLAAASAGAIAEGGAEKFTTFFGQVNAAAETGSKLTIPFKKLEKQLQGVGLNIGDLATKMGMSQEALTAGLKAGTIDASKFGEALQGAATDKGAGPLARAGAALGNIWAKFGENISKMFEDLAPSIDPFLVQVKSLFDIFGQGQASGQALKSGIGGFFKEVFADATIAVPYIKHFLLDLVIYGLRAYIALKPIVQTITDFGAAVLANKPFIDGLVDALEIAGVAIGLLVAGALLTIATAVALVAAIIGIQVAIVGAGLYILGFVTDSLAALGNWIAGAASAAADFVAGLVGGITSGASAVIGAVKGLAQSALAAFTGPDGTDSHSPSKKMFKFGGYMTDGAALGVEAGAPDLHGAMTDMASGGIKAAQDAGGGGNTTSNSSANTFNIVINGAGADIFMLSREAIGSAFEAAALAAGN